MKITQDLRVAIKAVCETAQAQRDLIPHLERRTSLEKKLQKSIYDFMKKKPAYKAALDAYRKALKDKAEAEKRLSMAGLSPLYLSRGEWRHAVENEQSYTKAGGVIPPVKPVPDYKRTIAQLAVASEAEGIKIIQELGIKW